MLRAIVNALRLNSSRVHLQAFAQEAANSLPPGALMLDAGAGDQPYRALFAHVQYESADFGKVDKPYGPQTYICDLAQIPVHDARYDLVLLTQVLEHLPEPRTVLAEMHRVLKPGARLWASAPLFFPEHEVPYDFYRYTQYGFRHLLESEGFEVERIEWLEGYLGTLSFQMEQAARYLPLSPRQYGGGVAGLAAAALFLALRPLFLALSFLMARLDTRHRFTGAGQCKNYAIVARKRGG